MSPVLFPPPPPTSNTLSSQQRSALVRSSKKLTKVLGDVPRVFDDGIPPLPSSSSSALVLNDTESAWRDRKPTHLPPLLKLSSPVVDALDSPNALTSPAHHRPPMRRGSMLSVAPSDASGSSPSDAPTDTTHRRAKLERLRRKLGHEVPATAVFPTTPHTAVPAPLTPKTAKTAPRARARSRSRTRTRSGARLPSQTDDARSVAFSISSDESMHTVTLTAARVHSPRPRKTKYVYQTGALPPIPPVPAHLTSASMSSRRTAADEDDIGLIRPRQKLPAGSMIGGADFKAAQRAKRERTALDGTVEPGELIEMVGFMTHI
ncbi:hypothetical protein J3R82DRAFT_1624 [Butyriboletus roseoflavus]|nr:hypothetical protein J3R82DRAFT_1624 [Butyriboletus roseoflavus]